MARMLFSQNPIFYFCTSAAVAFVAHEQVGLKHEVQNCRSENADTVALSLDDVFWAWFQVLCINDTVCPCFLLLGHSDQQYHLLNVHIRQLSFYHLHSSFSATTWKISWLKQHIDWFQWENFQFWSIPYNHTDTQIWNWYDSSKNCFLIPTYQAVYNSWSSTDIDISQRDFTIRKWMQLHCWRNIWYDMIW